MRRASTLSVCGLTLGATLSVSCASPPVVVRELRLDTQRFEHDAFFEVDRLVLAAGAHVRLERGALLMIRTNELVLEGEALIDGDGTPGTSPEAWVSRLPGFDCEAAHRDWEIARENQPSNVGGPGGAGGHVELRYRRLVEAGGSLAGLRISTNAGLGGQGRAHRCGCYAIDVAHRPHVKYGPRGPDGAAGSTRLIDEGETP